MSNKILNDGIGMHRALQKTECHFVLINASPLSGYGGKMMEKKITLTTLALTAFALAPVTLAQNAALQAAQKAGTPLVAYTQQQKAEPAPATQSPAQEQVPRTSTPSTPATQSQDSNQPQQQTAARTFSGTILKANDVFVLKTADNMTYQLDDQARAKEYEGKQVQVVGNLDASSNTIKVQDIKGAA
jgi:hypothetical protein